MGDRGQLQLDLIAGTDRATPTRDRHDAGLPDQLSIRPSIEHGGEQSRLEALDLGARVSEPGHLQHHLVANLQQRVPWQREEVEARRRDILSQIGGPT